MKLTTKSALRRFHERQCELAGDYEMPEFEEGEHEKSKIRTQDALDKMNRRYQAYYADNARDPSPTLGIANESEKSDERCGSCKYRGQPGWFCQKYHRDNPVDPDSSLDERIRKIAREEIRREATSREPLVVRLEIADDTEDNGTNDR